MTENNELPEIFQKIASDNFSDTVSNQPSMEQQAADIIGEMAQKYPSWAMSDVMKLKRLFNDARSVSGASRDNVIREELYRVAHDIKGQGATFGYPLMTDVATHLCNLIKKTETFSANDMDLIKHDIDDMEQILTLKLTGDGGQKGATIKIRLEAAEK